MDKFINRYATPLTTGLFAVSTLSGLALFFHWLPATFHAMHEWLSVVLLLPFAFHLWKNWRALLAYGRRGTLILPLIACLIVALPFAWGGLAGGAGGNPSFRALDIMATTPLSALAPLFKTTPELLQAGLVQKGYRVGSPDQTPTEIASAAGQPATEVVMVLLAGR